VKFDSLNSMDEEDEQMYKKLFAEFDVNGDGTLSHESLIKEIIKKMDPKNPNAITFEMFRNYFKTVQWTYLLEYLAEEDEEEDAEDEELHDDHTDSHPSETSPLPSIRLPTVAHKIFDLLDRDQNDSIDRNELSFLLRQIEIPDEDIEQIFIYLDTDRMGAITRQSFLDKFTIELYRVFEKALPPNISNDDETIPEEVPLTVKTFSEYEIALQEKKKKK